MIEKRRGIGIIVIYNIGFSGLDNLVCRIIEYSFLKNEEILELNVVIKKIRV